MYNLRLKVLFTFFLIHSFGYLFSQNIRVGAEDTARYFQLLKNKNIAVVVNPTSQAFDKHLLSFLVEQNINVKTIFALEHGIYGKADAGAKITDGIDEKTQLPVISLYGSGKEPKAKDLENIDIILFDIQDVGARFYTYISSLHYIMNAAAKNNKMVLVLDRPNPNGHLVDGPVLDLKQKSFVGMHPIPVLHGMTIGEYALMINGEAWLDDGKVCDLMVVPVLNYSHDSVYYLPVPPSPNLPNQQSIWLYPHLCFFEGTNVAVGRGTKFPFQVYGAPTIQNKTFSFVPKPSFGASNPKHKLKKCYGEDLQSFKTDTLTALNLDWILDAYKHSTSKSSFFNSFFKRLAGNDVLQQQIEKGLTSAEIKATWQPELNAFKAIRKKYLLYR